MSQPSNPQKSLKFKIGRIWSDGDGANEKHDFDAPLTFDQGEIDVLSNISGEVHFIKMKDEIMAIINDLSVKTNLICSKCLKKYKFQVEIPTAEREYLCRLETTNVDPSDVFLIDMKDMTIDLYEMIRQEIILHFPFVSVCSSSCKGLCPVCGNDRNKSKCSCDKEESSEHKPFQDLKKLFKTK